MPLHDPLGDGVAVSSALFFGERRRDAEQASTITCVPGGTEGAEEQTNSIFLMLGQYLSTTVLNTWSEDDSAQSLTNRKDLHVKSQQGH
eukprot:11250788-Ditylum_brightwellii.AAC.1